MADGCLSLIELSAFNKRQTQRVRMLLKKIPFDADDATKFRYNERRARTRLLESQDGKQSDPPEPRLGLS